LSETKSGASLAVNPGFRVAQSGLRALAPLFIRFAPNMTRKELTDFVGEKVA
jgi:hypothetical protein